MSVKSRILFSFIGLLAVGLLLVLYLRQPVPEDTGYIFDHASGPSIEKIAESKEQIAAIKAQAQPTPDTRRDVHTAEVESPLKDLFSQLIVGSGTTLHYFSWLGHEFRKASSREEHLAQVKARIFSQFPPEEASQLFETYKQYLDCEIAVADLTANYGPITSTEKGLALLREVQEFRREFLGQELADRLFGEQVKEKEYSVRRAAILDARNLYAEEKQEQLDRLKLEMWGESADPETAFQKDDNYARYRDALALHQKDLDEMAGETDRQAAINDIRRQYLPPDALERLKTMERQQAEQQQQEQAYFAAEKRVNEDPALSEDDKAAQIDRLRGEMLGDQAEAMKRRETIEKARAAMLEQADSPPETRP